MSTRILIDADGCPVVNQCIEIAKSNNIECLILCDTSHFFEREGATTFVFSKGADSVDFHLVNLLKNGDIVITQDYGLAAMCLARKAFILNQNGLEYTSDNIEGLLDTRYISAKTRRSGGHTKGPAKRKESQNADFVLALNNLLEKMKNSSPLDVPQL